MLCGNVSVIDRPLTARHRCQIEPRICADVVPLNALTLGVHGAEMVLGFGVTLFGSLAEPLHRLGKVLWRALAAVVPDPESGLGQGVALLCSLANPFHRLSI